MKKDRTILRIARKGLFQFLLVIFKPNRYGLVRRRIPAGEYGSGNRQVRAGRLGQQPLLKFAEVESFLVENHKNILL